jgi:hypothetical protein
VAVLSSETLGSFLLQSPQACPKSLKYDTITLRDLKRSSVKIFKKLGITKDLDKSDILMNAMLELDAHNWVSLINESRVSASWVINMSVLSTQTSV